MSLAELLAGRPGIVPERRARGGNGASDRVRGGAIEGRTRPGAASPGTAPARRR